MVRAASVHVRREHVPHQPREDPLVARRARAAVDRRVVHVHDHASGEERTRAGRAGCGECVDERCGEVGVDARGDGRGAVGVGGERGVGNLRAADTGECSRGDARASSFASGTAIPVRASVCGSRRQERSKAYTVPEKSTTRPRLAICA